MTLRREEASQSVSVIGLQLTALYSEGAHGGVEGEDVKVSLTVEDEVASHGVENCSITVDPQSDVTWVQIILRESQIALILHLLSTP